MGDAGVRDACHGVSLGAVTPCQHLSAVVAHGLHVDALVAGGGVAVVDPEERADAHLLFGGAQRLHVVGGHPDDLAGAQLLVITVAQVDICEALEGDTVGPLFFSDEQRGACLLYTSRCV